MKSANMAPFYCAIYPGLAELCRGYGYALAIHGSMARDFDLIAIPWVENPAPSWVVVKQIMRRWAVSQMDGTTTKEHGRKVYTLAIMGDCFFDLSFMPTCPAEPMKEAIKIEQPIHVVGLAPEADRRVREAGHTRYGQYTRQDVKLSPATCPDVLGAAKRIDWDKCSSPSDSTISCKCGVLFHTTIAYMLYGHGAPDYCTKAYVVTKQMCPGCGAFVSEEPDWKIEYQRKVEQSLYAPGEALSETIP